MFQNPILRGFHPDASFLRVGDTYYVATSTFEWFPGVMIYESKDLINWDLAARPLNRPDMLNMVGNRNSGSIWAPHLSYDGKKFWLMITDVKTDQLFKDTLNYVMTCERIDGEWSNPVYMNSSGFDPAIFHDDDGKKYLMNMLWDYRPWKPNFNGVMAQEFDSETLELIGERFYLLEKGSDLGVTEGPQIFKKDGYYYLLCAEGGTGYNHASTIWRGTDIHGPYEMSPYSPLITSRTTPESPLQKCGHASFVETPDHEWYISFICSRPLQQLGNAVLGRETGMAKIEWVDGWPRLACGGNLPQVEIEPPKAAAGVVQRTDFSSHTDFDEPELPEYFHFLRTNPGDKVSLTERPGYLRLYGEQCLASLHKQTLVARRWQSYTFRAETAMQFHPANFQQMAGMVLYYTSENWMYAYVSYEEGVGRILNILTCDLRVSKAPFEYVVIPENVETIYLAVDVDREDAQFSYSFDGKNYENLGTVLPADHLSDDYIGNKDLVFTGAFVGLCAQDMDCQKSYADFDYFNYIEK
ncbi:MAG: glycoside hydrolase family 43 protein [Lachnospiraceae bacterium]